MACDITGERYPGDGPHAHHTYVEWSLEAAVYAYIKSNCGVVRHGCEEAFAQHLLSAVKHATELHAFAEHQHSERAKKWHEQRKREREKAEKDSTTQTT